MWDNAKNDLSINNLYNLGFGGSTLVSCRRYFDRLVAPLNPSNLFFYAGDNDIGYGMDSDELLKEFLLFSNQVEEKLPRAKCFFISIKPSPFRRDLMTTILDANSKIKKHLTNLKMWDYIDITTPMINAGYDKFYDEDPLHMNELGYSLLSKLVRDKIYN
jgi:lysophospholipase L1-like esterase